MPSNNTNSALPAIATKRSAATTPSNAYKYGEAHKSVPCAAHSYKLSGAGLDAAKAIAAGGKITVMGLVCLAAKQAGATQTKAVNGAAIVLALRTSKDVKKAWAATRASAKYAAGALPCHNWCSGYVVGAANPTRHALLVKA